MDERLKSLLVLGREHYERHEYDRAEHVLHEVLDLGGDRFADVHNMLGFILHARGEPESAEQHFERAVEINPRYIEALMNLAVTYSDLGKYETAHGIYARIRELEGKDRSLDPFVRGKIANMHADLAQAYADAGSPNDAIEQLRKAVELCPTFADLQVKLGNVYRDTGNLAMARDCYAAACTANPRFVSARVLLGVATLALGNAEEAVAEWRAALGIDPTNKNAQMYLRMVETQRKTQAAEVSAGGESEGEKAAPRAATPAGKREGAVKTQAPPAAAPRPAPRIVLELEDEPTLDVNWYPKGGSSAS